MREEEHQVPGQQSGPSTAVYAVLLVIGMVAPALTFAIAVSDVEQDTKVYGLAATSLVYFSICLWSYKKLREHARLSASPKRRSRTADETLSVKLDSLAEANEFFGTSLQPADTFRLVSSRIRELYDFDASVLFLIDRTASNLTAVQAQGQNQKHFINCEIEKGLGLAGLAVLSGEVEFSQDLDEDRAVLPPSALSGMVSSVAIPVHFDQEPFGVLQLFSRTPAAGDEGPREILEAVGERIGPLLRGSLALEESLSTALTDPLTHLPNERAFFMILENQLAESIRFREERPLSVAVLDIKGFDEDEPAYGAEHAERLLLFVGNVIRGQLRKMDFLARSNSDEFLIILPTAAQKMSDEVLRRIEISVAKAPFTIGTTEVTVRLNVGRSCFWQDGETANQLLQTAKLRKQQSTSEDPDKVLRFPKEYVN